MCQHDDRENGQVHNAAELDADSRPQRDTRPLFGSGRGCGRLPPCQVRGAAAPHGCAHHGFGYTGINA